MGTWSAAVFGSDTAADARDEWIELVREGTPADDAASRVLGAYHDDDERDIALFALAATAWRHGRLSPALRDEALAAIASGRDIRRWQDDAPKLVARRTRVLSELEAKLHGAPPAPTRLRPAPPSRPSFPNGALLLVDIGHARLAVCRVREQPQRKGSVSTYEPLRWDRSSAPTLAEARSLRPIAIEPFAPSHSRNGETRQVVGPHRCAVIFRRSETRDTRLRVVPDVWPGIVPRTMPSHWSLSLASWLDHLARVIAGGHDPIAMPRHPEAVLDIEPEDS